MKSTIIALGLLAAVVLSPPPAMAGLSYGTVSQPGGFIQAVAFENSCGCGMLPGYDASYWLGTPANFQEQSWVGGVGPVQASASHLQAGIENQADGAVTMGRITMYASDLFPSTAFFSQGVVNGGFKEGLVISHPALTGQVGFLVFKVRARGTMRAAGVTGAATLSLMGYVDDTELERDAFFDAGNSDPRSTMWQLVSWSVASSGTTVTRTVDGTVTMSAPFRFGQPFTLGVYAQGVAGQRSSGGDGEPCSSELDFRGTGISWEGIASVQATGGPVTGYGVVGLSGIDWAGPADSDGDGALNGEDCAPSDPGAFAIPPESTDDGFAASNEAYGWTALASGVDTVYDVMRGSIDEYPVGGGASETCLSAAQASVAFHDLTVPPVGKGFYYLVRGRNACGVGTYGSASNGTERLPATCP